MNNLEPLYKISIPTSLYRHLNVTDDLDLINLNRFNYSKNIILILKKEAIKRQPRDLNNKWKARLEILSKNQKHSETQVTRIKQTIENFLIKHETADLVPFTKEIFNEKLHFLCSLFKGQKVEEAFAIFANTLIYLEHANLWICKSFFSRNFNKVTICESLFWIFDHFF